MRVRLNQLKLPVCVLTYDAVPEMNRGGVFRVTHELPLSFMRVKYLKKRLLSDSQPSISAHNEKLTDLKISLRRARHGTICHHDEPCKLSVSFDEIGKCAVLRPVVVDVTAVVQAVCVHVTVVVFRKILVILFPEVGESSPLVSANRAQCDVHLLLSLRLPNIVCAIVEIMT